MFKATAITLIPEAWPGPLGASILGRARAEGIWDLETVDLRQFGMQRRPAARGADHRHGHLIDRDHEGQDQGEMAKFSDHLRAAFVARQLRDASKG